MAGISTGITLLTTVSSLRWAASTFYYNSAPAGSSVGIRIYLAKNGEVWALVGGSSFYSLQGRWTDLVGANIGANYTYYFYVPAQTYFSNIVNDVSTPTTITANPSDNTGSAPTLSFLISNPSVGSRSATANVIVANSVTGETYTITLSFVLNSY